MTGDGADEPVIRQYIPPGGVDTVPPFDPRSGEHYWIVPAAFHIADPDGDGPLLLDKENLVMINAIGCYHCEEPYSPRLASRRCRGGPA